MRGVISSVFLAAGSAAIFVQHHQQGHGGQHQPADVSSVFKQRCMGCHVVPDPKFEADKAYIRQVYDTA